MAFFFIIYSAMRNGDNVLLLLASSSTRINCLHNWDCCCRLDTHAGPFFLSLTLGTQMR
jgi:hypothetical protein